MDLFSDSRNASNSSSLLCSLSWVFSCRIKSIVSIGLCAPFPASGDFWPVDVLERERPRTNMHTGGELSQSSEPTRVQRGNVWSWLADPARGGRTGAEGSDSWQ